MDEEVAGAFESAVSALRAQGHDVARVEMPDAVPSSELIDAIGEEVSRAHREFRARGEHYDPAVSSRIEIAEGVTAEATARARDWQTMIRSRFSDVFQSVDLLITPTTPARRKVIGDDMIGEKSHRTVLSYFSALVNHALHPALAAPLAGTAAAGVPPASLQAIGPLRSEMLLVTFGHSLVAAGIARFEAPAPNPPNPGGE